MASVKRIEQIMESLKKGNYIYRQWKGTNSSGYLSHTLDGVKNLREAEVNALQKSGMIEVVQGKINGYMQGGFKALKLK